MDFLCSKEGRSHGCLDRYCKHSEYGPVLCGVSRLGFKNFGRCFINCNGSRAAWGRRRGHERTQALFQRYPGRNSRVSGRSLFQVRSRGTGPAACSRFSNLELQRVLQHARFWERHGNLCQEMLGWSETSNLCPCWVKGRKGTPRGKKESSYEEACSSWSSGQRKGSSKARTQKRGVVGGGKSQAPAAVSYFEIHSQGWQGRGGSDQCSVRCRIGAEFRRPRRGVKTCTGECEEGRNVERRSWDAGISPCGSLGPTEEEAAEAWAEGFSGGYKRFYFEWSEWGLDSSCSRSLRSGEVEKEKELGRKRPRDCFGEASDWEVEAQREEEEEKEAEDQGGEGGESDWDDFKLRRNLRWLRGDGGECGVIRGGSGTAHAEEESRCTRVGLVNVDRSHQGAARTDRGDRSQLSGRFSDGWSTSDDLLHPPCQAEFFTASEGDAGDVSSGFSHGCSSSRCNCKGRGCSCCQIHGNPSEPSGCQLGNSPPYGIVLNGRGECIDDGYVAQDTEACTDSCKDAVEHSDSRMELSRTRSWTWRQRRLGDHKRVKGRRSWERKRKEGQRKRKGQLEQSQRLACQRMERLKGTPKGEIDLPHPSLATAVRETCMNVGPLPGFMELAQEANCLNSLGCVLAWTLVNVAATAKYGHNERLVQSIFKTSDAWQRAGRSRLALPLREGGLRKVKMFLLSVDLKTALSPNYVLEWARDCWILAAAFACNSLYGHSSPLNPGDWRKAEKRCVLAIGRAVDRLLSRGDVAVAFDETREKKLKSVRLNYQGEEMGSCHKLTLRQVLPALPPKEHGGVIDCLDFVGPLTKHLLTNPEECLLDDLPLSFTLPKAKIHIAEGERMGIATELVDRGVCDWIPLSEVAEFRGSKILNGLFGVEKPSKLDSGESVLRLIMNLVPSNSLFRQIRGSVKNLPSITAWLSSVVLEGEELRIWQSDMSNAFYLFRIPKAWMRYLSFGVFADGAEVGRQPGVRFALATRVLPMGWGSSVAVMQEISERILEIGSLPLDAQLTRNRALPKWMVGILAESGKKGKAWWRVYLDNFCAGEIMPIDCEEREGDKIHEKAETAWADAQVLSSAKKKKVAELTGQELGAFIDGKEKWIGGSAERFIALGQSTLYVLGQPFMAKKVVQVLGGRWIHVMQFRRPTMSALNELWEFVGKRQFGQSLVNKVRRELFCCLCLVPLMHTFIGAEPAKCLTASDASMKGGAVGIAHQLTDVGHDYVRSMLFNKLDEGTIPVMVVSLFNGIGGCFRCYDVLGLRPAALVSFDVHQPANRIISRRWPQAEIFGDVRDFTPEVAKDLLMRYTNILELHLWWGFPCTDLSSAKANRLGLDGPASGLFYEGKRIRKMLKKLCGIRVRFKEIVENVASMDGSQREIISKELGSRPYHLDCVDAVPMHRPRLCWTTEQLEHVIQGVAFLDEEPWIRVLASAPYPEMEDWICDGATWAGGQDGYALPTCMKAIRRSSPPVKPAGINRCSWDVLGRYKADEFRYPPYHYKEQFIFTTKEGRWRLVEEREKELLLGYGWEHTSLCKSASDRKANLSQYKDERNSLLGDSFSIFSFIIPAAALCREFIQDVHYHHLVRRMGLAPGFRCHIRCVAPIKQKLQFGMDEFSTMHTFETLNRHLLSRVNHTGSDVKIVTGEILNPRAFPRQSLEPDLLVWEKCFSVRWGLKQHINVLELRSILLAVRYHISHLHALDMRLCHITDSYVCMSVVSKGRSGSKQLRAVLQQLNALLLSHGLTLVLGHVDSLTNPTDEASR